MGVMSDQQTTGFRTEHDSMGEVQVPADALCGRRRPARSRTSRSAVGPFPRASSTHSPGSRPRRPRSTPSSACSTASVLGPSWTPPGGRRGPSRRPLPHRRLPDRVRHVDEHERQRGRRAPRQPLERSGRPPERPRQLRPVEQRHVPERPAHRGDDAAREDLVPGAAASRGRSGRKEAEFADVVKAGRTHLMDAVPVTLGQEFGGYRRQVELGADRVRHAADATAELPLGGTAAGTGLNAAPGFAQAVIERVSEATGQPFRGGGEPLRGAVRAGRRRRAVRSPQGRRRQPDEDLQRPAVDVLRTTHRSRRDPPA